MSIERVAPEKITVLSGDPALTVTQTGSGHSFVVEDAASPDTSAFVIDNQGRVGVGKTPVVKMDVDGTINATVINGAYQTTATSGGTTILTAASAQNQFFTGSAAQTVRMPVVSTLTLGHYYVIHNNGTGSLTIQSSGSNTIATLTAGTSAQLTCILVTGTTNSSWDFEFAGFSGASGTGSVVRSLSPAFGNTTGTAPFTVSSTTKVANLNADLFDDQDSSYYLNTSSTTQTKTGGLIIQGDLTVQGTSTFISTESFAISDNFVYLNTPAPVTITNAVGDGTKITYTTSAAHEFASGSVVKVTDIAPSGFNTSGYVTITDVSSNTFKVLSSFTGTYTSGGTARNRYDADPDVGVIAERRNGTSYVSAGVFLDTTDDTWKFFDGYVPDITGTTINTGDGSFALAPIQVAGGSKVTSNTATPALQITQTGAGDALLVEDSASTDTTPFVVKADGKVGIGTTSPGSSVLLDVRGNIYVNNINPGYTTTATAAGTTTLTVDSTQEQYFTGTSNQTIVLPVVSTLALGHSYVIHNNGTGTLTVNSSGGNLVGTVTAGHSVLVACILITGTTAASWSLEYFGNGSITGTGSTVMSNGATLTGSVILPSGTRIGQTTVNQGGNVTVSLPTLAGTLVGTGDAGSITTGMLANSSSTSTGVTYAKMQYVSAQHRVLGRTSTGSGNVEELTPDNLITAINQGTTAIDADNGGTGQTSYVIGDILFASSTTALSRLAGVATGNALISGGVGVAPSWGKIGLTTHISGTLGVGNGGTGITTTPANGAIPIGNGTNYTAATLTAGSGISVTNASGSVTIANTGVLISGDQTVGGIKTFSSEVISSSANGFRITQGNFGAFFRNDGTNFYLLQTASGTPTGSFNAFRSFYVAFSSGLVGMDNCVNITTQSTTAVPLTVRGIASQTADLQEWRNSAGTVVAEMTAAGNFLAVTKSFDIEHPTKEGMRLRYGSLEGPENGVYVRGRGKVGTPIELPDYWTGLVDPDSITVQVTPNGKPSVLYVEDIADNTVTVGGDLAEAEFFYFIQAERVDVDKLVVEYDSQV